MTNLLKITDVCKTLSVGRSTIYELIGRGEITPVKVLGAVRFVSADIDAYIAKLREQANDNAGRAA